MERKIKKYVIRRLLPFMIGIAMIVFGIVITIQSSMLKVHCTEEATAKIIN